MKRQSDIGWFELIMGLILIILGIVCEDGTIYRFRTGRFSGDRNPWNYGGIYADRTSGSRHMGNRNDSSNLDHCTLYFQTFASPVYEDAFRNDVLYNLTDFEYSGADRRNPSDLPSDDHDFLDGCSGRRIPDHRGSNSGYYDAEDGWHHGTEKYPCAGKTGCAV